MALPLIPLRHGPRDAEDGALRAALRLSQETTRNDTPFRIMILGGGARADAIYKQIFARCAVFVVGNHFGADIQGEWSDAEVWAKAEARAPDAVIVDAGSDSHMSRDAAQHLAGLLKATDAMLLVSPPNTYWYKYTMEPIHFFWDVEYQNRYNVMRLDSHYHFLFAFSKTFERREIYPLEILQGWNECDEMQKDDPFAGKPEPPWRSEEDKERERKRVQEIRDCYEAFKTLHGAVSWYDGLQVQLSLVTSCVDMPEDV